MKARVCIWLLMAAGAGACATSGTAAGLRLGAELEQAIAAEKFRRITSVVLSVGGELIYENYWNGGSPEHLNDTRSAMKSLTAMALGTALDDGKLTSLDAPVFAGFTAERPILHPSDLRGGVTIRDLATMSSALDCNDDDMSTPGNEEHMHATDNWTKFVLDLPTRVDYTRNAKGHGDFAYCTAGTFLLGQIIGQAVGEPVDRYIERRLLQPMGIDRIEWPRSPSGEAMTGGGAELTSRALLKLGELALNKGRYADRALLSESWVEQMLSVQRVPSKRQDYGLLWWREDFACGDGTVSGWYMGGNGGNKIVVINELETVAVITATLYGTRGMHQQSSDILQDYLLASLPACAR